MWFVPSDILISRDWGLLPDYVIEKAVVVVTGTWEGAELFDRPLAYLVANEFASREFFPIVMSDVFILEVGKRLDKFLEKKTPLISIGSRVANALTALVAKDTNVNPDQYVGVVEWRGTVVGLAYGRDPLETRDAVYKFLHEHLDRYIEKIKTRRLTRLTTWPRDKAATTENSLLSKLLNELKENT